MINFNNARKINTTYNFCIPTVLSEYLIMVLRRDKIEYKLHPWSKIKEGNGPIKKEEALRRMQKIFGQDMPKTVHVIESHIHPDDMTSLALQIIKDPIDTNVETDSDDINENDYGIPVLQS